MNEIFTLKGETNGTSTTGDFPLNNDLFYYSDPTNPTLTYIRLPRGLKAKIWCKRISGAPVRVRVMYTKNIAASPPVWAELGSESLASEGELALEKRRPFILRSTTGLEAFKFSWAQTSAAKSYLEAEVEIGEE